MVDTGAAAALPPDAVVPATGDGEAEPLVPDLAALEVTRNGRVVVVSDLPLTGTVTEASRGCTDELIGVLAAWDGPGVLVIAGDGFEQLHAPVAPIEEILDAHQAWTDAVKAFATGKGHNVVVLPGNHDGNIAWDPQGVGKFRVLFGAFKAASFRQQLTSSGNQQFVDRSLVSDEYAKGRDIGVAVQGVLLNNKVEYRASIMNGAGQGQAANDNDTYQYNGRLMWQPNGNQTLVQRAWVSGALYSESDFESTTVPLYAVAGAVTVSTTRSATGRPVASACLASFAASV